MFKRIVELKANNSKKVEAYLEGQLSDDDMLEYLLQWDTVDNHNSTAKWPFASDDTAIVCGNYYMYHNNKRQYVGLTELMKEGTK